MTERIFTSYEKPIVPEVYCPTVAVCGDGNLNSYDVEESVISEAAIEKRDYAEADAIVIAQNGISSETNSIAMSFSMHIRALRMQRMGVLDTPCITGAKPMPKPLGYIRVPHLITKRSANDILSDSVIWELQSEAYSHKWLGAPVVGQQFVEDNIDKIINLRRSIRNHDSVDLGLDADLTKQIHKGRYISMLFVYQNLELFKSLLESID